PGPILGPLPRCSSVWGLLRRGATARKTARPTNKETSTSSSKPSPRALPRRAVRAIAFRVADAAKAYDRAIALGPKPVHGKVGPMELNIPAIEGIGGSLIYLVDRYGEQTIYHVDFPPLVAAKAP